MATTLTISLRHGLALADPMVYATAKDQEAEVITGDAGGIFLGWCTSQIG
jgi:hypothetical protein